jgi:hypothetical protein
MDQSEVVREMIENVRNKVINYDYSEVINALNTILNEKGGAVLSIRFLTTVWSLDDANNWIERYGFNHLTLSPISEMSYRFYSQNPVNCKYVVVWDLTSKGIMMLLVFPKKVLIGKIANKLKRLVTDQSIVNKENMDYIKYPRKNIGCSCL